MKKQPSDSLELMLDAICNVFGAVLIIAITVGGIAVTGKLLKNNSAITAGQLEKAKMELAAAQTRLDNARTELNMLRNLPLTTPLSAAAAIDSEAEQKYNQAVRQANTLADQIENLQLQQQQLLQQISWLQQAAQPGAAGKLQQQIDQLQNSLQKAAAELPELPLVLPSGQLQPWRLLLDARGNCYLVGDNQAIHNCQSPGNEVAIKRFEAYGNYFYHITPQPGRGRGIQYWSQHQVPLPEAGADKYFVELLCDENAVAAAAELLQQLRSRQYPVALRLIPAGGAVLRTAGERSQYEVVR